MRDVSTLQESNKMARRDQIWN